MSGFFLSFVINLIFRWELLVLAVLAWLAHHYLHTPIVIVYVLLGLWILISLLITLGLGALSKGAPPPPYQKNVNSYSKKTEDFTDRGGQV